jgi:hypothetical protein
VPAGLVLLALGLRLPGIDSGLPQVYEEAYPFKIAWGMWGWGPDRGLDLNPHWFRYPGLVVDLQFLGQGLLYLWLTATGAVHSVQDFRILHQLDKTPFYLMGRFLVALLGALTVLPVFHLTRRVAGQGAAVAAALLVAASPPLIAKSQVIEVDVPLTLFVAWGLLAAFDLAQGPTRRRAIVAGMVVGLAATAKYPGIVLFLPCLVALALGRRAAGPSTGPPGPRGPRSATVGWPEAIGTVTLAFALTAFLTSPYLFLDHRAALADLAVEREHMRLGHFGSDLGSTWRAYARDWCVAVAGWPLALASSAGLVAFLARRRSWALVAGSFVLAYAGLVSSFAMKADRYLLPLLPPACLFAAALVAELIDRVAPGQPVPLARRPASPAGPVRGRARSAVAWVGATALLAQPALVALPGRLAGPRADSRTVALQWFEANVPPGAFVVSEPYGPPLTSPLELQAIDRDLLQPLLRQRPPKVYAVVSLPMFQVNPDRSAAFYDPGLYRVADAFIVTGGARDRYRREPARFAAQLALYDTLESSWIKWREFPSRGGPGPEIVVYRNPAQPVPFAERRPLPGPPPVLRPGPPTGGEAYFYYNVGLNYEMFGFAAPALDAYLEGLEFAAVDPASGTGCAQRAAQVLVRAGRTADAMGLLERAAAAAPRPSDAARLRAQRDRLRESGP